MFGQRASSQIVCRPLPWMSCLTSAWRESALGARTFIHSGRRGRSETGSDVCIPVSLWTVTPEAAARETKAGLVHDERGWFVVSAREERWNDTGPFGFYCDFEGKKRFLQLGFNISVLEPGHAIGAYHR